LTFQLILFLIAARGMLQHVRSLLPLCFDFGLVVLSGLFLGTIYYGRNYQGPMYL
jgi:hypothetical protein